MDKKEVVYSLFRPVEGWLNKKRGTKLLSRGTPAPDFTVAAHDGKRISLGDLRGKHVVLWFYPKADTLGCTIEACGFRDHSSRFREKNTEVLGVSFDTVDENRAFAEKFGLPFRLLCDTTRELGLAYGACLTPSDRAPIRIGYLIDPEGRVKRAYPHADAKRFPELVLEDI
jgi:peroxiredoxin Q/BCP